jgi:hypothetical protein
MSLRALLANCKYPLHPLILTLYSSEVVQDFRHSNPSVEKLAASILRSRGDGDELENQEKVVQDFFHQQ